MFILIIIATPLTLLYKFYCINGLYHAYIQFIDIKGTAWGRNQVIEMCSHAIVYISYVEREPASLLVAICI